MAEKYGWCKDLAVVDYKDEEGKEYCVFHAPEGEKCVTVTEFNNLVFERINLAKAANQSCNLSGTIFEWDICFQQFDKNNPLPPINFLQCIFYGEVDFIWATLSGMDFTRATFDKITRFKAAKFNWYIRFGEATFIGDVEFSAATFEGRAYFADAVFEKGASFNGATFKAEAVFSYAMFERQAIFIGTTFNENTVFFETIFNQEAIFAGAKFNGITRFIKTIFIKNSDFTAINTNANLRFEGVNMNKISFVYTDLRRFDFVNCTWPKRFGRNFLYDEITIFGDERQPRPRFEGEFSQILKQEWDGFKKDISCDKEAIKKVEILYRMLKQKYKEEHNEYEVSNWHYGEKEMFRKGSYFRRFFPLSLSNLYWLSSGYGERPVRAGIVLISLIFILSILTAMSGFKPPEGGFAAIILNTLQYATLQKATLLEPASLAGAYLKLLTQILIPLQTALFALAIKNRFKR